MTKKSQSRVARDNAEKSLQNTCVWDDVRGINQHCYSLLSSHLSLQALIQNEELRGAIKDISLFEKNIVVLSKDLTSLTEELNGLSALHKDKTGGATTPDEHMLGISIYEKYYMFMERHSNVVMPNVLHLLDQLHEAERIVTESKKIPDNINPDIITDAVIVSEETRPDTSIEP
jgi:hypothetical protein